MSEREKERERQGERDRERERDWGTREKDSSSSSVCILCQPGAYSSSAGDQPKTRFYGQLLPEHDSICLLWIVSCCDGRACQPMPLRWDDAGVTRLHLGPLPRSLMSPGASSSSVWVLCHAGSYSGWSGELPRHHWAIQSPVPTSVADTRSVV